MTELVFILDRSGSMAGLEADTIGGFNSMIAKQKKEAGEALVSTVLFDNESVVIHDRLPLEKVPPMTEKEYFTRGCTALLDAVGGAIHHIGNIHKYARREERARENDVYHHHRRLRKRQPPLQLRDGARNDRTAEGEIRLGVPVSGREHRRGEGSGSFRHRRRPGGELQVRRGRHGAEL